MGRACGFAAFLTILNLSERLREGLAKRRWIWQIAAMVQKLLPALMLVLFAFPATLSAQDTPPAEEEPAKPGDVAQQNRFWQANVGGGQYMVALDRISAISRNKYVLDGAVIVDEVTVDALGQALARFYFITPITDSTTGSAAGAAASRLADRARGLVDKGASMAGTEVHNMVVKKYPETTHARTIEFRVLSEQELTGLFNSVRTAWESNRGRKFTVK
jgi:hypothetical protein